jgi:hypothetical protein
MRAWIGKYLVAGAVGGILLGAAPARADFILTLTDGSATVSVTDQGAGDLNPLPGVIVLSDDVGIFLVNVTTGLSKPLLGGPGTVEMDLNSVNVLTGGAGTLTIQLTDTDFSLPAGDTVLESLIGGTLTATTGSSLTAQQCIDFQNAEFGCGAAADVVATNGPFGVGAFSSTVLVPFSTPGAPFSLTESVVVAFAGPGSVSFDFNSSAQVPYPGTLVLVGLGMLTAGAAGGWRAWRRGRARPSA